MGKSCYYCIYFTKSGTTLLGNWVGWCGKRNAEVKENQAKYCSLYEEKKGCFLTTACVAYFGKSDDCFELTTLRAFRDNVMKKNAQWNALVEEYYAIAPAIVERIDALENRAEIYAEIYKTIQKILVLIEQQEHLLAVEAYKAMVLQYKALL